MPTQTKTKLANYDPAKYRVSIAIALIRVYRTMFLSRRLDDREIQLKRQKRFSFRSAARVTKPCWSAAGWS